MRQLNKLLLTHGKTLADFPGIPIPPDQIHPNVCNPLIQQELVYDRDALKRQSTELVAALNSEQKRIFDRVLEATYSSLDTFFFVQGFGGTGKTFLWNALATTLRARGEIVITVASSGIAATLLPSGRTAHSRFAIPIRIHEHSVCNIKHRTDLAELLVSSRLIIWDEAPMVQRYCIEAFDRSLKDIMQSSKIFGGKCVLMGGDFRQILPVIPKGTRAAVINACLISSFLWRKCTLFQLTTNMRLLSNAEHCDIQKLKWFSDWLLSVGDGRVGEGEDGIHDIEIPHSFLVPHSSDPIQSIVCHTYKDIEENFNCCQYFNDRAILAPTIETVDTINEYMCSLLPGPIVDYYSCDSVCKSSEDSDMNENLYTTDFLNTISSSGLPQHKLSLKIGCPIMLLRNIDQTSGLCNGTRLLVTQLGKMLSKESL